MERSVLALVWTALSICYLQSVETAGDCDNSRYAPYYPALECVIRVPSSDDGRCYVEPAEVGKTAVDRCDRLPCLAWTGIQLEISCEKKISPQFFTEITRRWENVT